MKFEANQRTVIPNVRVEKAGEEVLSVAFDLGLDTEEQPIAMVFDKRNGETHIRKLFTDDDALELHKLLTE